MTKERSHADLSCMSPECVTPESASGCLSRARVEHCHQLFRLRGFYDDREPAASQLREARRLRIAARDGSQWV